jgi:GH18 family chitinase
VFAGTGKVEAPGDIEPALSTCTHLVYGFGVIDGGSYKLVPLDEYQELDSGKGYYRAVTSLKKRYPGLNILLSVGGLADPDKQKYLTLVCNSMLGAIFIL